jgi:hypothetical protein
MMLRNFSHDKQLEFLKHFHQLDGIDPMRTNHDMVHALFGSWDQRNFSSSNCKHIFWTGRGSGVTRTLIEWAKWIEQPILAIAYHCRPWKEAGIDARLWLQPITGLRPRPSFVLIDNPVPRQVFRSVVFKAKFDEWLDRFPYPAFYVEQGE